MEPDLVARAADAVAAAYLRRIDLASLGEPALGVVATVYYDGDHAGQLAPSLTLLPQRKLDWCERHGEPDFIWSPIEPDGFGTEVPILDVAPDPELRGPCEALFAEIERRDDLALLDEYLLALGRRLHDALGMPVVVDGLDETRGAPLREQLLAQLPPEVAADWQSRDLLPRDRSGDRAVAEGDVLLHVRTSPDRIAGIYRRAGHVFGTTALGGGGTGLQSAVVDLGGDPAVVAGALPPGAVAVRVQDLRDAWHEAQVAEGYWLAVLPHAARGGTPPVRFLDAAGREVPHPRRPEPEVLAFSMFVEDDADAAAAPVESWDEKIERVLAGAAVPKVWPATAPGPGRVVAWGSHGDASVVTSLDLEAGGWRLTLTAANRWDPLDDVRDVLEQRLDETHDRRTAGRLALDAGTTEVPGSVAGEACAFAVAAAAGMWAAVGATARLHAVLTGPAPAPERLDLH